MTWTTRFFPSLLFLVGSFVLTYGQKPVPSLSIHPASEKITIDGELNEHSWDKCEIATNFYQSVPFDTGYAQTKIDVRVLYDEKFLYVSAVCHDDLNKPYVIQSLRRDFEYEVSDAFGIYIDPYDDLMNGFHFAVNPKGVQREGLVQVGGRGGVTTEWDILWYSEVKNYEDKWVAEIAIPFTSLRFNNGEKKWRINFSRNDLKRNEGSSWSPVPRNFDIASLPFTGHLIWDKPFTSKKKSIALIPYLTGGVQKAYQPVETKNEYTYGIGGDARIGITNSLQLDLTINPDFSQVEVDRQVTNLSRFSLFFPERRNFFIENSDLFSDFGFRQIRPFFSRKIGLNRGQIVPILAGARLSGKVGKDWRIGAMNMHTRETENAPQQNYSVAAVQRNILKNSTIGVIAVNRQGFDSSGLISKDHNRVIGSDFNFNTIDRKWSGKALYHYAITPEVSDDNFAHATFLAYSTPNYFIMWNHEYVGRNHLADVGFVPRIERFNPENNTIRKQAYWRLEPMFAYTHFPEKTDAKYISQRFEVYVDRYTDAEYDLTDNQNRLRYRLTLANTNRLTLDYNNWFTKTYYDRDLTFSNDTSAITPAGEYEYNNIRLSYESDARRALSFEGSVFHGEYYNGSRTNADGGIYYRWQPYGRFGVYINQNSFNMPGLAQNKSLTLIGSEIELSFTKSIFFSTFMQYNTQIDNFNINSRLQWRFKPMSDLFIVYSNNYNTTELSPVNRGLVIKLNYWFQ
jgi:hypothetical protein